MTARTRLTQPGRLRRTLVVASTTLAVLGSGVVLSSASSAASGSGSVFVPVASCRLLDTRPGSDNVGSRATPLGADDTLEVMVRGVSGNCTIPADATAVSMNVTVVGPTSTSFLTVYASDVSPRPLVSSLNWVAGQAPTANAVTSRLSADGRLSFYNLSGSVDLLADIVGYYTPASAAAGGAPGPAGPTGPTGATGPAGAQGPAGADAYDPTNVLHVATSGGEFSTLGAALAAIGTTLPASSSTNPYLIEIGPGTYTETSMLQLESWVEIRGAGTDLTTITCNCTAPTSSPAFVDASYLTHVAIRQLTFRNTAAFTANVMAVNGLDPSAPLVLDHVSLTAVGSSSGIGLQVDGSSTVDGQGVTIDIDGTAGAFGVRVHAGRAHLADSSVTAFDAAIRNDGGTIVVTGSRLEGNYALMTSGSNTTIARDTMLVGSWPGNNDCVNVFNESYLARFC
jgi:hypothetical protein